jgi:Gluconate 2-dehydrogenase subunit 3
VIDEPSVLDASRRALLKAMLNRLVPSHADLPGAGDLDVGAGIERTLAESVRLRRLFADGLHEVAIAAQRLTGSEFVDLDATRQTAVLRAVEQAWPAFFGALVEHTYRGYYSLPEVQRAIGATPRPPQPLGYHLPPFDPALLDRQRQRSPFWRTVT